ncbi:hypothetical protein ON010_g18135 [Phytophthora cinnamomi]|nr:hypothetical protein ON010_g18135 [Phytophthora cinnamomi]
MHQEPPVRHGQRRGAGHGAAGADVLVVDLFAEYSSGEHLRHAQMSKDAKMELMARILGQHSRNTDAVRAGIAGYVIYVTRVLTGVGVVWLQIRRANAENQALIAVASDNSEFSQALRAQLGLTDDQCQRLASLAVPASEEARKLDAIRKCFSALRAHDWLYVPGIEVSFCTCCWVSVLLLLTIDLRSVDYPAPIAEHDDSAPVPEVPVVVRGEPPVNRPATVCADSVYPSVREGPDIYLLRGLELLCCLRQVNPRASSKQRATRRETKQASKQDVVHCISQRRRLLPVRSHVEEVLDELEAVLREDALRVELPTLDLVLLVPHAHDHVGALDGGRDLEHVGQRLGQPHERVVADGLELGRHALEQALAVVHHDGRLAVHDLAGVVHCAAEDLEHALVAQTHARDGDLAGERADHVARHARVLGVARPGRDHDAVGLHLADLVQRDLVVAPHLHMRPELGHVLQRRQEREQNAKWLI